MAGIVAASTDNGIGIAGVGFDGVSIMPVSVLGADGTGRDSDVIEGLVWAADHGADVALMAFSAPSYSSALQAAVDYAWSKGMVLVAATGNDGSSSAAFPAGDRGVIGVSNTDPSDALNASSNYGAATFLAAPGTSHRHRWRRAEAPRPSRVPPPPPRTSPRPLRSCAPPTARCRTASSSGASPAPPTRSAPPPRPATAA